MRIADSLVEKLLLANKRASQEQLAGLRQQAAAEKQTLKDKVIKSGLVNEKDLTELYAAEIDVPFVELNATEIKHDVLKLLPERIAAQYKAIVFGVDPDGTKLVAM
ncbi:MAG TPA: type II/IV secretion system protein, partial [Candidatus Saccharimonadales bacterium]|nr:type II/IV secretion system protein [Candidatus Saccharimonadales bacterium]